MLALLTALCLVFVQRLRTSSFFTLHAEHVLTVTSAVRTRVRLPSLCEGERGFAFLQQRRDGGVPSTQGGDDAHGKNELMGHCFHTFSCCSRGVCGPARAMAWHWGMFHHSTRALTYGWTEAAVGSSP